MGAWQVLKQATAPVGLEGTGVVICGGGPLYFSSALVIVRLLRGLGCYLPVEVGAAPQDACVMHM